MAIPELRTRILRTAAVLSALLALGSCAANLTLAVNGDGSGTLAVDARVPETAAARLRSYASPGAAPASGPLFDPALVRSQAADLGMATITAEAPSPDRFRGSFAVRSLSAWAADPAIAEAGILDLRSSGGTTTLAFSLSRRNAAALPALFPGLDPDILEALSPPALDPYPVTAGEYREMLGALLGEAAAKELEAAEIRIRIRAPGPVSGHSGGSLSDRTLTVVLGLLDLLVLERPVEFSLGWR